MAIISIRDEAHWHELRAKHIGGSDVAALFDLSPYATRWQLWMEKAGKIAPEDLSDNKAVQAGKFLEAGIANWAAHSWSMKIDKVVDYFTMDDCEGMGATFDYITQDGAPVEIKWSARGYGWSYEGDQITEAPENYLLQVQHQIAFTDSDHAWLIALIDHEPRRMKVPRNEAIISAIKAEVSAFWQSIRDGKEPAVDLERDVSALTKLLGTLPKSDITLEEEHAHLFAAYKEAKALEKKAVAEADAAKAQILIKVREKLETVNTSKDKAAVKCGDYKMSISKIEDNPGSAITPDMVGQVIGKRSGYTRVTIS